MLSAGGSGRTKSMEINIEMETEKKKKMETKVECRLQIGVLREYNKSEAIGLSKLYTIFL